MNNNATTTTTQYQPGDQANGILGADGQWQPVGGPPAPEQSTAKKPIYKKKRYWALAIVATVFAIQAANGGGSGDDTATPAKADGTVKIDKAPTKKEAPAKPKFTAEQENAMDSAQTYLDMSGFSKKGLVQQLVVGDDYPRPVAAFAVNHLNVDWNKQAVRSAKNYLDMSSFSHDGLVQQLVVGDNYTHAEAEYGTTKAGL